MEHKAKTVKESQVELIHLSSPNDANIAGKVHGGVLMKLIDEAAYATASKHSGHACVTASVNRTDFFHPIHIGDLITIKASVNYVGKTSMDIGVKVESQNLRTEEITHTTSSYLTLVALDDRGKPVKIPALIAETEEEKNGSGVGKKDTGKGKNGDAENERVSYYISIYIPNMTEELKQQIQEYIEGHNVCTLAIADRNSPSAHTMYYVSHDLHIYFESEPQSSKTHILRKNPNISLTIDEDYKNWRKIKGIQLFGHAKLTDEKHAPKLQEAFAKKFPHINDLGGIPAHHVFVEIIPEKIYFMDFSKKFGHKSVYHVKDVSSKISW